MVRIGIIGAGRIGRVHAEALARRVVGGEAAAVVDPVADAAEACARDFGVGSVAAGVDDLLGRHDIDAVAICSSTDTHADLIEAAAGAGKAVFCEKPIALDLAAIDRAMAAVNAAGVPLQVGFNRRFFDSFRRIREAVAAGEVGPPHLVRVTSRDPGPPPMPYIRVSGGLFLDMTIHDFDLARFLTGLEIEEVFAAGAVLVDPAIGGAGDVDTAVVTLRFAGGALGVIENSRRAVYGYDQRVEVFGPGGMVTAPNPAVHPVAMTGAAGTMSPAGHPDFRRLYFDSYAAELQAFVDAVRDGAEPAVTGEDGRLAVVAALAATESARLGRPVRLAEISPVSP